MLVSKKVLWGSCIDDTKLPERRLPFVRLPGICNGQRRVLDISEEDFSKHIINIGGTGSGKTNVIHEMVLQIRRELTVNDVMLVFDTKKDFADLHTSDDMVISNENYRDFNTMCPTLWNIFMELVADGWDKESIEMNADEIANLIFADTVNNSPEPFFPNAAKYIFAAILKAITFLGIDDVEHRINYMNNAALRKYLRKVDAKMLVEFLGKFPELCGVLKYIGDGTSDQALGVLATLENVTAPLFKKNFGADGRFAVRDFVKERQGKTLFLEYDLANGSTFTPVYRVLVDMFLKEALSIGNSGKVYVVCDELKLLPHLLHLEDALNFGRSLGICVIVGLQSMEQLYEMYGQNGGRNIASAFQTNICFHTNNAATREYVKEVHGANFVAIQHTGASNNLQEQTREGYAVEDWDMVKLELGEAIVGLPFEQPVKFKFERFR